MVAAMVTGARSARPAPQAPRLLGGWTVLRSPGAAGFGLVVFEESTQVSPRDQIGLAVQLGTQRTVRCELAQPAGSEARLLGRSRQCQQFILLAHSDGLYVPVVPRYQRIVPLPAIVYNTCSGKTQE